MLDLKSVLETMKKTYTFIVKVATEVDTKDLKYLDTIFKLKGMIRRTKPELLPMLNIPTDFPKLKDYFNKAYKMEMEFEYPIAPNQIKNEICMALNLDRTYVIVRTEENPIEQYHEDYLKYKDEDYIVELLKDAENDGINPEDYYGDKYNEELVKTLQSKEAKKYQQGFKEVDKKKYKGFKKG